VRTIAQHYADALADVAVSENVAGQIRGEFADFLGLLTESPNLGVLLGSPAVPKANKRNVVEALIERTGASRTLRNFLFVVLDHRRLSLLNEIHIAFDQQLDVRQGITRANVTSARELDSQEKERLSGALTKLSGRQVKAEYKLDPALIAGAVVRIGSTIYDGSVRTQLERLRTRLASQ